MQDILNKAIDSIRKKSSLIPKLAIVLGSGLGFLADEIDADVSIPYGEIEGFPQSSVAGHAGKLVLGHISDLPVVLMAGRVHYYEGFTPEEVVLPIRVLKGLGAEIIILTNAAGGIHPEFKVGDLMLIEDHINFLGFNPLRGPNDDEMGTRFPDMTEAYDPKLRKLADGVAKDIGLKLRHGVYLGCQGPSYETPAEIRMFRGFGADAVGMSTVPESIVANHMGMKVLAISFISNAAAGLEPGKLSHDDVKLAAEKNKLLFGQFVRKIVEKIAS